ncbi:MAG TPA: sterol desaturase family protein [Spirochaetia bacterium]|nr:sterol desaturase family protein [Spirochaetia bacterium]
MHGKKVQQRPEPIRLFKSDFLEFFSHVSPITVIVLWGPVALFFLIESIIRASGGRYPVTLVSGLVVGWIVWTFAEYTMHRFIFHFHPKTEKLKHFFFTVHGVHHAQPLCKTRLVMPPAMSIPLAVVFYCFFYLLFDVILGRNALFYPVFTGFLTGYIIYDLLHYSLHHSRAKSGYFAMCRHQHMQHHGTCPSMRFGVTSPVWDYVFGTMPKPADKAT